MKKAPALLSVRASPPGAIAAQGQGSTLMSHAHVPTDVLLTLLVLASTGTIVLLRANRNLASCFGCSFCIGMTAAAGALVTRDPSVHQSRDRTVSFGVIGRPIPFRS